jgi:peptidoglycan/LPS O-acetylase OafA/YrhL
MSSHLRFVDRLRAIGVIGVIVVHTTQFAFANFDIESGPSYTVFTLLSSGRFGVEVFFLLSGFLLSYLYEDQKSEKSTKQYFLARFFRIWPLWILFSCIWALVFVTFRTSNFDSDYSTIFWVVTGVLLSSIFLLWISPEHFDSFIGGAWSIQIEVLSYFIFAFLRGKSVRLIIALAIGVNLLGLALAFTSSVDGYGLLDALRRLSFQTGFNFFVLGWLFSRVFAHYKILAEKQNRLNSGVPEAFRLVFGRHYLLAGLWAFSFLVSPAVYGNTIEVVGFVILALVIAQISGNSPFLAEILERTGKLSYFMFFMHFLILFFANHLMPIDSRPSSLITVLSLDAIAIILIFGLCFIPATLSLRFFETPIMNLARRLGDSKSKQSSTE